MDKIAEKVFKSKIPNEKKLVAFGFEKQNGGFVLEMPIMDGQFVITARAAGKEFSFTLFDSETQEPFTLFLVESAEGNFLGEVRAEYEAVLLRIAESCCDEAFFKNEQTSRIIAYAREKYQVEPEFLWEDYDGAVLRRSDTKKWFGALMIISPKSLGLIGEKKIEVLDLRMEPAQLESTVDGVKIFRGYHMNKKHWITVIMDESLSDEELFGLVDESYRLAVK